MRARREGENMIHAWYEKIRDQKDHIYFSLHEVKAGWERSNRFPGFHNSIEIAVGVKGCIEIAVDGQVNLLHEGEICFLNSFEPHRFYYGDDSACYIILISSGFFNEINKWGSISYPTHMAVCEGYSHVREYLDFMWKEWDASSLLCKRAFADTLGYLMLEYYPHFPKTEPEEQSIMLLSALQYICEHCTERLRVEEVARKFGYSANYFSTAFNEFMGMSFPDYLNSCRMIEYTRVRREHSELSTSAAAQMCGFGSMNTFYRTLRRFGVEGYAPSEIQKIIKQEDDASIIGENDTNSRGFGVEKIKKR